MTWLLILVVTAGYLVLMCTVALFVGRMFRRAGELYDQLAEAESLEDAHPREGMVI